MRPPRWATPRLLPIAAGLGVFLVGVWPVLDPEAQLFYRDTGRLYYPVKKYLADRLAQGQLPLWDPWTEAGASILGQMSPGLLHPWTLLYLVFPFDLAFKLNHLLPLLLAGCGTYLLARRLGASRPAATAGGLIFGASGYLVAQASANLIFVVGPSGVPIALERFLALLEAPSRRRLLAASALLALCAYGGEPQSMLMCGLIGASFAVARALSRRERLLRPVGLIAVWGALAAALSAPVAVPAAVELTRSKRAAGLTPFELASFAVTPPRLLGLFVPRAFDDSPELAATLQETRADAPFNEYLGDSAFTTSFYLGAGALLLAGCALLAGRRGRFFLFGGLFLTVAACGDNLGLQPLLRAAVPGYALFRYAEKQMGFASLLLAVAAALGLDAALRTRRRAAVLAALAAASAAALAICALLSRRHGASIEEWLIARGKLHSPRAAATFVGLLQQGLAQEGQLVALLAAGAALAWLRPSAPGRALVAASCAAAALVCSSVQLLTVPVEVFHALPPLARELERIAGPSAGRWRLYVRPDLEIGLPALDPKRASIIRAREPLRPHFDSLFDVEGAGDYFSAVDSSYAAVVEGAPREVFELLTVRFFVIMPTGLSESRARELGFTRTHFGMWILTLPPRPRGRLLDRIATAASAGEMAKLLPRIDSRRTALLLPADAARAERVRGVSGSPGAVKLSRPTPEHISAEVSAAAESVLEVGEHYNPGWRAQVDGKPAATLAVDGAIAGVVVPAGRHTVDLRFRPTGFFAGIAIALSALIAVWVTKHVRALTNPVTGSGEEAAKEALSAV